MNNLSLYIVAILIWGSTWLVIKFQLGVVAPTVSVAWRFALASLMLLLYSASSGKTLRFGARDHLWIALQGVLLFGLNYIGIYLAEQYLGSGLVAIVFSLVVSLNTVGMRLFFSQRIKPATLIAAVVGIAGVTLVFWPQLQQFSDSHQQLSALRFAFGATTVASLSNMVAMRNHRRQLPVLQVNAWSMLYGAIFVAMVALASGQHFAFDFSWPYVASLLYLALFGSALAFGAYLTLMSRIGADRAGYTAVAIPIVALLLSTAFEHLHWQIETVAGMALCLLGNWLILRRHAV